MLQTIVSNLWIPFSFNCYTLNCFKFKISYKKKFIKRHRSNFYICALLHETTEMASMLMYIQACVGNELAYFRIFWTYSLFHFQFVEFDVTIPLQCRLYWRRAMTIQISTVEYNGQNASQVIVEVWEVAIRVLDQSNIQPLMHFTAEMCRRVVVQELCVKELLQV